MTCLSRRILAGMLSLVLMFTMMPMMSIPALAARISAMWTTPPILGKQAAKRPLIPTESMRNRPLMIENAESKTGSLTIQGGQSTSKEAYGMGAIKGLTIKTAVTAK